MKKIILFILFIPIILGATNDALAGRINKYAGVNAPALVKLIEDNDADSDILFLIKGLSSIDLATMTAADIITNCQLAKNSMQMPYNKEIPADVYQHFVLPHRVSQEPLEPWREKFWKEISPLVKNIENIELAALTANMWLAEYVAFEQTSGRDQGPVTTMRRGIGRCEEISIILVAGLRSIGIPARNASVPFWNITDNNHAWVELWTPDGWRTMEGAYPANNSDDYWFVDRTRRASLVVSRAFGRYNNKAAISTSDHETRLNVSTNYTQTKDLTLRVFDELNLPVDDCKIVIYAASYGGLFALTNLTTNASGEVEVTLGLGGVFATATTDSLFAYQFIDTLTDKRIYDFNLSDNFDAEISENIRFLLPSSKEKSSQKIMPENFELNKEMANLRREKRFEDYKKTNQFIPHFDGDFDQHEELAKWLDRCDLLAAATDDYLLVLNELSKHDSLAYCTLKSMISEWNIKDLVEYPDSSSIMDVATILASTRANYRTFADSIWHDYVLMPTFSSTPCPSNAWERTFYEQIRHLSTPDIEQTVLNVENWLDDATTICKDIDYSFFSPCLNPVDIINMQNITAYHRRILLAYTLRFLGIPVKYTGILSYYDGSGWQAWETKKEPAKTQQQVNISLEIDGEQVEPKPFSNFLLAKLDKNGFNYIYLDGTVTDSVYTCKYYVEPDAKYYVQAVVRNLNGDYQLKIIPINIEKNVQISMQTPPEFFSTTWPADIEDSIKNLASDKGYSLIIINHKMKTEPEKRLLNDLNNNAEFMAEKMVNITIGSSNKQKNMPYEVIRNNKALSSYKKEDYPLIFLCHDKKIITSAKGYYEGIIKYLKRKIN